MGRKQKGSDEPRPYMSDADHRAELVKAFKLEPGDLEANRAGTLSPHQPARLRSSGVVNLVLAIVMAAGLVAILATVATHLLKPVQYILGGLLVIVLLILGSVELRKCRAAAAAGVVECLSGPVQVTLRSRTGWFLSVAGTSFKLPIRGWHVGSGASYRVYTVPLAKRIIAMEPDSG